MLCYDILFTGLSYTDCPLDFRYLLFFFFEKITCWLLCLAPAMGDMVPSNWEKRHIHYDSFDTLLGRSDHWS